METTEQQYLSILKDTIENGTWVENKRTGARCLTTLNHQIKMEQGAKFPILTTRKMNWRGAINEMVAYMRGYTKLEQFHSLNVKTWDANAQNWDEPNLNSNKDSVGLIYGASAKEVGTSYEWIIEQLRTNPTDRGIIWNFWNPQLFNKGCLRPCMYSHQFNVLGNTLHLTSTQRSTDLPLGGSNNLMQAWFLLDVTARLTGFNKGTVTINWINSHIYENQVELAKEQLTRSPLQQAKLVLNEVYPNFVLEHGHDVTNLMHLEDYFYHPSIKYPFTV